MRSREGPSSYAETFVGGRLCSLDVEASSRGPHAPPTTASAMLAIRGLVEPASRSCPRNHERDARGIEKPSVTCEQTLKVAHRLVGGTIRAGRSPDLSDDDSATAHEVQPLRLAGQYFAAATGLCYKRYGIATRKSGVLSVPIRLGCWAPRTSIGMHQIRFLGLIRWVSSRSRTQRLEQNGTRLL